MSTPLYPTVKQLLEALIAFDTTSRGPNLPFIRYVEGYLKEKGVPHIFVNSAPDGIHANLLATLPASNGDVEGGLLLSGHSDVVPVDGQKWDTDPFKLTEKDGKLYGRGSCDMKGFIAICLALVPEWLSRPREKPIHIALTFSEETTFEGVFQLVKDLGPMIAKCEGCIVGEATMHELVIAHKSIYGNTIIVKGKAAHSSLQNSGYNAIEPLSRVLQFLFALRERFVKEGPFEEGFSIPYTTLCPALVSGGNAMNTIPEQAEVYFEFRSVPCHDGPGIRREIEAFVAEQDALVKQQCPEGGVEFRDDGVARVFCGNPDASIVSALQHAIGRKQRLLRETFSTEAGEYQAMGIDTVVCGPGSIDQAHKANEYISIEQLKEGERVLRQTVNIMCFGGSASTQ